MTKDDGKTTSGFLDYDLHRYALLRVKLHHIPVHAGPPLTPNIWHPYGLPQPWEDNHIISAVLDMEERQITGMTPAQDRVSFICTSCVAVEYECLVICEYCIPRQRE